MKEITEDRYDDMREVLPPIYINQINGQPVRGGFVVTEPYTHNSKGPVFTLCWKDGDKFYEALANVMLNGKYVGGEYNGVAYQTAQAFTVTSIHRACKTAVTEKVNSRWICPTCGPIGYGFDVMHVPRDIS